MAQIDDWDGFVEANEEDEMDMEMDEFNEEDYDQVTNDKTSDGVGENTRGASELPPTNTDTPFLLNHPSTTLDDAATTNYDHMYGSDALSDYDELETPSVSLNMMGRELRKGENWRRSNKDDHIDMDWYNQVSSNTASSSNKKKVLSQRQFVFATRLNRAHFDPLKFGAHDRVPEVEAQQCTLPNGRRIFFPISPKDIISIEEPKIQLLNTPISTLVQQVDEERLRIKPPTNEVMNRQNSSSTSYTTHATLGSMSDDEEIREEGKQEEEKQRDDDVSGGGTSSSDGQVPRRRQPPPNSSQEKQLWVDKYAPHRFSDLLSAENINRGVLNAIKSWDSFVFNAPIEAARACEAKATAQFMHFKDKKPDKTDEEEKDKRPRVKVVLLCGPPGLGKTTLAHVVAKHAGYNPIEVNASDDRSAAALRERLVRALESKSVFGDKKPNLVILDEIDGADAKGSINAIVEVIKAPLRKQTGKGKQPLTRPLICICNDIYAAHLRPLREVALVYNFKNPSEARLLTRLKTICKLEAASGGGLGDMSASALQSLCHATNNDTRSAINTLQFVAMRYQKSLKNHASSSAMLLRTIDSGLKDERKDVFEVFSSIFWTKYSSQKQSASLRRKQQSSTSLSPRASSGGGGGGGGGRDEQYLSGSMYAMASAATHGEYDMISSGIHENFIKIPFIDPSFTKTCEMTDWLCWQSQLQRKINDDQMWFLLAYIPAVAAATFSLAAVDYKPQFVLPKQDFLFHQTSTQRNEIVISFQNGIHVKQCSGSRNTVVLDLIPQLLTILSPKLRPVSSDVFSKEEKQVMAHMVDTLESFGLSYTQAFGDREQSGGYQLTPELDLLVQYEKTRQEEDKRKSRYNNQSQEVGKKPSKPSHWSTVITGNKLQAGGRAPGTAPLIPNFLRMMVARDVELTKFRRTAAAAAAAAAAASSTHEGLSSPSKNMKSPNKKSPAPRSASKGSHKKLKSPTAAILTNPTVPTTVVQPPPSKTSTSTQSTALKRDFFGRVIEEKKKGFANEDKAANHRATKLAKSSLIGQDIHKEKNQEDDEEDEEDEEEEDAVRVKYSFQKGFTNAIKRPVYMSDLM